MMHITLEYLKIKNLKSCYFEADNVKNHSCENIVPVIDGGVFHNYVHVYKQLFLHDVIESRYSQ